MRIFYIIFLLFISIVTYGQQRHIDIIWADQNLTKTTPDKALSSENLSVNPEGNWTYAQQWKDVNKVNPGTARLTNVSYSDVPAKLLAQLKDVAVPSALEFSLNSRKGRDIIYTVLSMNPIIKKDGRLQRVMGFDVEYAFAKAQPATSRMAITNSVLASNDVYKFFIEETGVHRINRSFLQSLGMNTNNINPAEIKVFGLGGAPLPFRNSDNTEFDLGEIAIRVVGGEDGSFDNNDYILFYGTSTKGYIPDMDTFVNPYADRSYYYVTVSPGNGKRVLPMEQPSAPATTTFTTFDDLQFHEEDLTTLVQIGRRWMGERFGFENEQTFEFTAPNPVGNIPAKLRVVVASTSESNTSFDVAVNGNIVGNVSIPGISGETFARSQELEVDVPITTEEIAVTLTYNNGGNPASQGYLDFISLDIPRSLTGTDGPINFTKNSTATSSGIAEFAFSNASAYSEIWDVTLKDDVRIIENIDNQGEIRFKATQGTRRDYVAVHNSNFLVPRRESGNTRVPNQDLKGNTLSDGNGNFQDVDYLMITGDELFSQASRLAQHNRDFRGLNVKTVRLSDIYEEFGGGKQDIGAIRNFVRYVYENASSQSRRLQYVCLFGDASVDYKNRLPNNTNFVPTFQTWRSFNLVSSFMSDDYFGSLDPEEGYIEDSQQVPHLENNQSGGSDKLDLAVGRIVADSPERARVVVDKILEYDTRDSFGRWRNNFVLISDDVDEEFEFNALEGNLDRLGDRISSEKPFVNVIKIHSDAFQQVSSSGGDRYPQVNDAIANAIEVGALVVTYLGHGGEDLLAAEAIVTQNEVKRLDNGNRLPLLVTVTCEFTKFDNPLRETGGEQFIWNPDGGAVALVATTREISVRLGVRFNDVLAEKLFSFGTNTIKSVAENLRESKNEISDPLRRVIFFLGDPAMKLAFPKQDIRLTALNDIPVGSTLPNLRALDKIKLNGVVTTQSGQPLTSYNGKIAVTLYDKEIDRQTLGNDGTRNGDGELLILDFKTLGNILYRGQASVENGIFETEFIMPRDTSIPLGEGRISFYAERESILENQTGVNTDIIIGGLNEDAPVDNLGPKIRLFMNDEGFVNGGITNDSPFILAKLEDENGINTASGIGHDIVAIIDGDETNPIVMNDFYETEVDDFMRGTAKRKIRDLEPGPHTLTFKAWDVYNNSSTAELQFIVIDNQELELKNVLNYPNPFVNYTEFWFNHNRPFEPLDVQVQIFTVSGKVVKTINQVVTNDGFLSRDIVWDGLDDFGQAIGKGVYVYKLSVKSTLTNKQVEKFEKLVIL
ncbi:peptidase C25 [Dokdonia sinensis]|uniref:Peptidase C25 n=1 Tax=Dokdonia sinensis TaxID=2479847 RepID=A0A3M0G4G3_9FLAO|nr:type IX secretion system sortase PorU [Dokdonia sinensis]RMB57102.1 peptidase C25 [Dokdonia sinensis]